MPGERADNHTTPLYTNNVDKYAGAVRLMAESAQRSAPYFRRIPWAIPKDYPIQWLKTMMYTVSYAEYGWEWYVMVWIISILSFSKYFSELISVAISQLMHTYTLDYSIASKCFSPFIAISAFIGFASDQLLKIYSLLQNTGAHRPSNIRSGRVTLEWACVP